MDKEFKNNTYRILELFMNNPNKDFSIRGMARNLKISHATVINYITDLEKLRLIKKKNETLYPTYYANTENDKLKFYKKNYITFKIKETGVIEYIKNKTLPSSIVLFGSCAKREYKKNSDIDIFVEAQETRLDISKFEKILKRNINLLFEKELMNLSAELRNNILNGIILYGFVKLRG